MTCEFEGKKAVFLIAFGNPIDLLRSDIWRPSYLSTKTIMNDKSLTHGPF